MCNLEAGHQGLAFACYVSPYILLYKHAGDAFTRLPDPDVLPPDYTFGVTFSPCGNYVATASYGTPYMTIYKRSGDTFTKLPDPAILPTSIARSISFRADYDKVGYLAVGTESSPFIAIYKRNGDVFTKFANPATTPTGACWAMSFSPDGVYLAAAHYWTPYITIYKAPDIETPPHSFPWIGRFQLSHVTA